MGGIFNFDVIMMMITARQSMIIMSFSNSITNISVCAHKNLYIEECIINLSVFTISKKLLWKLSTLFYLHC